MLGSLISELELPARVLMKKKILLLGSRLTCNMPILNLNIHTITVIFEAYVHAQPEAVPGEAGHQGAVQRVLLLVHRQLLLLLCFPAECAYHISEAYKVSLHLSSLRNLFRWMSGLYPLSRGGAGRQ